MKNFVIGLVFIALIAYFVAVILCNIKHNSQLGRIPGWDPCASCWALQVK